MRKILWVKRAKRTRFSQKKAKPGAFWVLERMGTVGNRGERMEKSGVRTNVNHITMQHMQKENRRRPSVFAGFVAGTEGLVSAATSGAAPRWGAPSTDRGGSQGQRRSLCAIGTHCPLGTRFWSGCGNAPQGTREGRCCPVPAASPRESGAILVLRAALAAVFQVFYTFSFL